MFTSECWHLRQLLLKSECERARSPDSTGSAVAVAGEAEQTVVQTQICFSGASPRYITAGCIHPGQHFFFSNCTTALLFGAASCLPHLMQTAADCVEVKSHHGDDLFVQHDDTFQEKHKEFPVLFFCFLSLWLREEEWWNLIGIILNPFLWGRDTHTHAHAHTMYQ